MALNKRFPQASFWAIVWSTFAFGTFMYLRTGPEMWQLLVLTTFLGAVLVTAIADGQSGLATFLGRIVRWRVPIKWYAVTMLLPRRADPKGLHQPVRRIWLAWRQVPGCFSTYASPGI